MNNSLYIKILSVLLLSCGIYIYCSSFLVDNRRRLKVVLYAQDDLNQITFEDIKRDQRDLNIDQTELNRDQRELNRDQRELNRDQIELNRDQTKLNRDQRELNRDQRELNKSQTELPSPRVSIINNPMDLQVDSVPLVTTACGMRVNEDNSIFQYLQVFLKSLVLNLDEDLSLLIAMDDHFEAVELILREWPPHYWQHLNITVVKAWFPPEDIDSKDFFKRCSLQRLYFPVMFPFLDALMYADLDVLFLRSPTYLIKQIKTFNSSHVLGLGGRTRHCLPARIVKKPCFNDGVLLMNLKNMRNSSTNVMKQWIDIKNEYNRETRSGTQKIFNIFVTQHPETVKKFSIEWDFSGSACLFAGKDVRGAAIIHGTGRMFLDRCYADFLHVFQFYLRWSLGDPFSSLVSKLKKVVEIDYHRKKMCKTPDKLKEWILHYPIERNSSLFRTNMSRSGTGSLKGNFSAI